MTFRHKLARRLALLGAGAFFLLAVAVGYPAAQLKEGFAPPDSPDTTVVAVVVTPASDSITTAAAAAGITPPNGTKVWCTLTEVDEISSWDTTHFMWPDIINGTTYGFDILYDDLTWWIEH